MRLLWVWVWGFWFSWGGEGFWFDLVGGKGFGLVRRFWGKGRTSSVRYSICVLYGKYTIQYEVKFDRSEWWEGRKKEESRREKEEPFRLLSHTAHCSISRVLPTYLPTYLHFIHSIQVLDCTCYDPIRCSCPCCPPITSWSWSWSWSWS